MYLKASMAGFLTSSREYFECTYWSRATSRTLDIADRWRITLAVLERQSNPDRTIFFGKMWLKKSKPTNKHRIRTLRLRQLSSRLGRIVV
jgi:hypothetical protein